MSSTAQSNNRAKADDSVRPAGLDPLEPAHTTPTPGTARPRRTAAAIQGPTLGGPGVQRTMPTDLSITVRPGSGTDTERAARERGPQRQSMRGFEDTYTDIVDYIVRITHRIWEDQDAGYIYDTYAPGCFVYDDSGPYYGVERVVEGTIASIHAFPDLRSFADEVIWAGNDEEGFVTSHRYVTTGHHLGAWRWGPATGRKVDLWGIANCVIRENEIFEEWVLYNMTSKFAQLGIDVKWAAREYGNELNRIEANRHVGEVERLLGGRLPQEIRASTARDFDVEHFVRGLFHNLYNRRDLSAIDRAYQAGARFKAVSNRLGTGRQEVKGMARALLATFPDLGMQVDEVYWMGNEAEGYRVSVRWTATGTHRGYALYGDATGRRVHLWGINHLYVQGGRITEDWMMFNEFDVLAQIFSDEPSPMIG
ncbi:ester cyclase [Streptomyces longwoodensis]|uniref:ester cyclase n=1 Tax=Streptomyces longwoodensis TaxID=68231 RepID=UPI0033EFE504